MIQQKQLMKIGYAELKVDVWIDVNWRVKNRPSMILLDVNPREYTRQSDINKFTFGSNKTTDWFFLKLIWIIRIIMSLISIIKSSKFVDKIILIMVICFSKTITRGSNPSNQNQSE